jgi:hypothetical protein
MATFASWLSEQETRSDQARYIAKWWNTLENRPRASSPAGIEKALRTADPGQWEQYGAQAWGVMLAEYREQRGDTVRPVPAAPVTGTPDQAMMLEARLAQMMAELRALRAMGVLIAAKLDVDLSHAVTLHPVTEEPVPVHEVVHEAGDISDQARWSELALRADWAADEEAGNG